MVKIDLKPRQGLELRPICAFIGTGMTNRGESQNYRVDLWSERASLIVRLPARQLKSRCLGLLCLCIVQLNLWGSLIPYPIFTINRKRGVV